ncbi:hypothetical protein [Thermotoga profunda]|uniref:hypothetical protein n=1 Tax=Thermotoga profunda TaxID=1508420 RepID=UPI00059731F6|nr:hypothetical protein [Thermotoga profunda]
MKKLIWTVLIVLCFSTLVLAETQQIPEPIGRPSFVVSPQILIFSTKEIREKSVFVYNTNVRSAASWTVQSSNFIRVDSDLPNPLPALSGGYLKVSVNWSQVDANIIRVENPDLLHKLLSQILGTELPSKPIGFGLISISEKIGAAVYVHIIKVVILK